MNNNKLSIRDILFMAIGEAAVALLVVLAFLLLDGLGYYGFSYRIITGALLGVVVTLFNYSFLIISVDHAINKFLDKRGSKEMDEEEADKFAAENAMPVQNAIKTSFILRTASMLVTLVIAFLLDWFNPIATAIPLLAFRPLLTAIEMIKGKITK